MKNKFSIAMSLAVLVAMLVTSLAFADNVLNDVVAGGNDTITSGGSTIINYRIQQTGVGNDGQNGCNASDGSPATVTINTPAGVTVDTSGTPGNQVTLTFNTCGTNLPATFTSSTPGNYTITVSVSDSGTGTYNTTQATFTLHVNAPADTTPPVISYVLTPSSPDGSNDWYKSNVSLVWTVTDPESSVSKTGCVDQNITADQAATTYSCSATSAGGSAGPVEVTIKRDATAPSISAQRDTAANTNGWNNTDVASSYTASDATSGLASPASGSFTFTSEGAGQSHTFTVTDLAGNSASADVTGINIDKTLPTASASASPAANDNGWNNTNVTVSFSGNDGSGSGIDFCDAAVVLSGEGAGQSASGTCTDLAGNVSATATASGINIDKTNPSVSLVGGPANGSSYYFGSVPAAPTCSASDALSGLDGSCSVSGYSAAVGTHTVTANADDKAGNSASASATYTVLAWTLNGFYQPVDMNGVYNTVKGGSTVPLKFEIFAGSTELTATSAVSSLNAVRVTCSSGTVEDAIEITATGATSLRYDTTGGQFIYNWKTPTGAGTCYKVTMTAADGSTLIAFFKLK